MNHLQSFLSDLRSSAAAATLEDPQPNLSIRRIATYAAFEKQRQGDMQIALDSPLVRWASVELSPSRAEEARQSPASKTPT